MERYISILGLIVIVTLCWLCSRHKKHIQWRTIVVGIILQWIFALFILRTKIGASLFNFSQDIIEQIIKLSDKGAIFIFGEHFQDHFFAFKVLPTIIFISSLSALLFHWGILQKVVSGLTHLMKKSMKLSGSESLVTAANIFLGQNEAPLFIKPYIATMTRSEILVMMGSGMASVAGGVLAAFVGMGISAGHLVAASFMSAPACLVICKLLLPETEASPTMGHVSMEIPSDDVNSFDAACRGAKEGLNLALVVAAMLIAFIALVALANLILSTVTAPFGYEILLQDIFGWVFMPVAWLIGVPLEDCSRVGQLIGERMVLNEFVAYMTLADLKAKALIGERAEIIATYALCGFANFSSIAIQIGGIGSLEPSRKKDLAELGFLSMICGTLAGLMTACIAGILI